MPSRPLTPSVREMHPADWGFKVSVCIAVLCEQRTKVVCVTDQRVSFGDFSAEYATFKNEPILPNWVVLFAGNDVEHADPIIRAARENLMAMLTKLKRRLRPDEVAQVLDDAYSEQLQAHIENKILRKHRFDSQSFQRLGKQRCTPEVYARTWDRIDKEELSLAFLACGFDEKGRGHIWLVTGNGAPVSYDSIGLWAIGTGAPSAMNSLSFHVSRQELATHSPVHRAVYTALSAKFMAESASDVGKSTFVVVLTNDANKPLEYVSDGGVDTIRKLWEKRGTPRVPKAIDAVVPKLIYGADEPKTIEVLEAMLGKPGMLKRLIEKSKATAKPNSSATPSSAAQT